MYDGRKHSVTHGEGVDDIVPEQSILLIEDDPHVTEILDLYLRKDGYKVTVATDGHLGLQTALDSRPDLVVLDVMLPGLTGWEVLRRLRERSKVPVLMLTAKGTDHDKILGLDLGADDYVPKPFNPVEVVARIRAILRRMPATHATGEVIAVGRLSIDISRNEVVLGGHPVGLTRKEIDLLWLLAQHPGQVFSRAQLLDQIWGYDYVGDTRTVDTHVKRLRQKLESTCPDGPAIRTIWGIGYKLEPGI